VADVDRHFDLADLHRHAALLEQPDHALGLLSRREGGADEPVLDVGVLAAAEQPAEGLATPRPARPTCW